MHRNTGQILSETVVYKHLPSVYNPIMMSQQEKSLLLNQVPEQ